MLYFLYGEDSYRSKRKLEEIIEGYKKVHKSGLNLIYVDAKENTFNDFFSNFKITSMFAEKKLIILQNVFANLKFQEDFLENLKSLESIKDIVVVYEKDKVDQRTKFFRSLQKNARLPDGQVKCQESSFLQPALLKKWAQQEFEKAGAKINNDALDLLTSFAKNDLWRLFNEINKLSNYKKGNVIESVLLLKDSIIDVKHIKDPKKLYIGGHKENDFTFGADELPGRLKVLSYKHGQFYVSIVDKMRGYIQKGSKKVSFEEIKADSSTIHNNDIYSFPIEMKDIIRIEVGNISFYFLFVGESSPLAKKQIIEPDPSYHTSLFLSFVTIFTSIYK